MKKLRSFSICLLLLFLLPMTTAYAGSINQYEAEVLEAAEGLFEYGGKLYQVDSPYLEKLRGYLASDDVNLSEEDKDKILDLVEIYIASGVKGRQLVPVEGAVTSEAVITIDPAINDDADAVITNDPEITGPATDDAVTAGPGHNEDEKLEGAIDNAAEGGPGTDRAPGSDSVPDRKENPDSSAADIAAADPAPDKNKESGSTANVMEQGSASDEASGPDRVSQACFLLILGVIVLVIAGIFIIRRFTAGSRRRRQETCQGTLPQPGGYTDIHTHILPGVDDGAVDMEETCRMLKLAIAQKTEIMIATPHYVAGADNIPVKELYEKIAMVMTEAVELDQDFQLYAGNELFYSESIIKDLQEKKALTLAGSRYVLVEFYPDVNYSTLYQGLGELVQAGYAPILAHMERYRCMNRKKDKVLEVNKLGCYIQINCGCFINRYSHSAANYYAELINRGWIHFIASDCHNSGERIPNMGMAADLMRRKVDEESLKRVLIENPGKVIGNIYI